METLQDILKRRRQEMKLSLRDAAKLIGISHSHLHNLEQGLDPRTKTHIKPTPDTLKLISKAYGIDYEKLMELSGYLKNEDEKQEKPSIEKFKEDLVEKLKLGGYNIESMTNEEIDTLIEKVIKILDISIK